MSSPAGTSIQHSGSSDNVADAKKDVPSDLDIVVESVKPAFVSTDPTGEWYSARVNFHGRGDSEVRLPFTAELANPVSGVVGQALDYQVERNDKWVAYWQPGMRAYISFDMNDSLVVSRGHFTSVTFYLPFRERDGDPLTFRIKVGDAVSEPFTISWRQDRLAGRFGLAREDVDPPKPLTIDRRE